MRKFDFMKQNSPGLKRRRINLNRIWRYNFNISNRSKTIELTKKVCIFLTTILNNIIDCIIGKLKNIIASLVKVSLTINLINFSTNKFLFKGFKIPDQQKLL